MRVLLVEDDPTLNRQLDMALQAAGYAVDVSTNGRDAWAMPKISMPWCSTWACRRWTG